MSNSTTHCIYRIVCFATGKVYIGRTKNPRKRQNDHFSYLRKGKHPNTHLQRAFNKYGEGSFYFEVLEKFIPDDKVAVREIHWVNEFDSYRNGFNRSFGGETNPNVSKPCEWNGVQYPSIIAAATALGVDRGTMEDRFRRGYSCDEDIPSYPVWLSHSCVWNGIAYPSISKAAKANGVSGNQMQRRFNQGYTCDADIKAKFKGRGCTWNGTEYPTIKAAAKALGVSHRTMRRRLEAGYTGDADMIRRIK